MDFSNSSINGNSGRSLRKGSRIKHGLSSPRISVGPVIPNNVPVEYLTHKSAIWQRYQYGALRVDSMSFNFSDYKKFYSWRQLWTNLAKAQKVYVFRLCVYMSFCLSTLFAQIVYVINKE